jgi:putative peptidoglycan lipid II flippase
MTTSAPPTASPEPQQSAAQRADALQGVPQQSTATGEAETLYGSAGIVTFFTLLSRTMGMVRDLVISHLFGASGATDAWVQAFRIPNALRRLTAEGSMTIAFIPVYVELRERQGREAALLFARKVLGLVLLVTVLLCVAGMVWSRELTLLFSPGYAAHPGKLELTAQFTRWMFPYLVMVSVVAWAMGILNAEKRFWSPAASPVLLNVGMVAAVLALGPWFRVPALSIAVGILAGGVAQVLLQLPSLLRAGIRPIPARGWMDPEVRRLFRLLGPAMFGVAVYQINILILGVLASYLPTGQVFHYNNATRLTELVMGLFTFAFTTAGLPTLSEHTARRDWERIGANIRFTFAAVSFTIVPATVGLMVAADSIVSMLYLHGAFLLPDVSSTARTAQFMALGMPAVGAVRVMVPVFYALGDSRTPVAISALTLGVTTGLGWWLSGRYEVAGLALGLSLGTWFQAGLMFWRLGHVSGELRGWFPWRGIGQHGLAAAVMGVAAGLLQPLGTWRLGPFSAANWVVFAALLGCAMGLYAGVTLLLGEEQARHWVRLFNRVRRRLTSRGGPERP